MGALPHSVVAHGWIPFLIVMLLALIFSVLYVMWYRSDKSRDKAPGTTAIAILGLFVSLITSILVPVDVFLVSFMKNDDGSWKPWAESEEVRESLKSSILHAYYSCYGLILFFAFFLIPANFFYHGLDTSLEDDDDEPTVSQRLCHSFKYVLLSVFLFALLVTAGIFIPFEGLPPSNSTEWEKLEWFFSELEENQGKDLLLFLLNTLTTIGLGLMIFYTGYGVSSLPCGLIRPTRGVRMMKSSVERQIDEIEKNIREISSRFQNEQVPRFEQSQLERLEQQARLLRREHRDLDQRAKSAVSRCQSILRPFQMVIGVVFSIIGFIIFSSLFLTNLDKALHSGGPLTGYTLQNNTLPNPVDLLLVVAQQVFPLDYVCYAVLVLFLLSCSISGISNMGIRFCFMSVYKIRAWKTPPRGLLLAVLSMIYIILALNIVMFSIVPDYSTFGNQHYQNTVDNITSILRCSSKTFPEEKDNCVPSRISVLLFSFHYKAWIFGAAYYWLTWVFLAAVLGGSLYSLYNLRTPQAPIGEEEDDLLDSDDDEPSQNPFD